MKKSLIFLAAMSIVLMQSVSFKAEGTPATFKSYTSEELQKIRQNVNAADQPNRLLDEINETIRTQLRDLHAKFSVNCGHITSMNVNYLVISPNANFNRGEIINNTFLEILLRERVAGQNLRQRLQNFQIIFLHKNIKAYDFLNAEQWVRMPYNTNSNFKVYVRKELRKTKPELLKHFTERFPNEICTVAASEICLIQYLISMF